MTMWRRSVYCRNCGVKGHNRRGCPSLTADQKAIIQARAKTRACSWCNSTGHNKTSCDARKKERVAYIERNAAFRHKRLSTMRAIGLGIGALVTTELPTKSTRATKSWTPSDELGLDNLYLVAAIDWNAIQEKAPGARVLETHSLLKDGYTKSMMMPNTEGQYYNSCEANVLSGVKNPDNIAPPEGWLKGESGIDQFFR